jgi:alpha,alpha-trehalase
MFEKFSTLDIDSAGRGGEYTVQVSAQIHVALCSCDTVNKAGFGWTNGVVLWIASNYGQTLVSPQCPPPLAVSGLSDSGSGGGATILQPWSSAALLALTSVLGVLIIQ